MSPPDLGTSGASSDVRAEEPWPWWAWTATFGSYVALGYVFRSVFLNWIVGPLYPLVVMYLLPTAARRVLGRPTPPRLRPPDAGPATPGTVPPT